MVSYFERRKRPPLQRALSSRPFSLISLPSALSFSVFTKLALATPWHRRVEKVAFGCKLDNVGSRLLVIYSIPAAAGSRFSTKVSYYLKLLLPFFVHGISYSPGCSPGLSLIMYGTGKQWPSARRARVESVRQRQAFFFVPKTFILLLPISAASSALLALLRKRRLGEASCNIRGKLAGIAINCNIVRSVLRRDISCSCKRLWTFAMQPRLDRYCTFDFADHPCVSR